MRALGNVLITVGIVLLIAMAAFIGHQWLGEWLKAHEVYAEGTYEPLVPIPAPSVTPRAHTALIARLPTITPTSTPTSTPTPLPMPAIRIKIPRVQLNEAIQEVGANAAGANVLASEWQVASFAVGHHDTSAYPGEGGNIILSGHNNTAGSVFKDLDKLKPGDKVLLFTADKEFVYEIVTSVIIRARNATEEELGAMRSYLAPTAEEQVTLISCWPWTTYTHRIFVIAKSVATETITKAKGGQ